MTFMLVMSSNMSDDLFVLLSSIPPMEKTGVRVLVAATDLATLQMSLLIPESPCIETKLF